MHNACMTVITIRNVPEGINDQLKRQARARGQSLQQYLLRELEEAANRSTLEERLREVLGRHPEVDIARGDVLRAVKTARGDRDE